MGLDRSVTGLVRPLGVPFKTGIEAAGVEAGKGNCRATEGLVARSTATEV